MKSDGLQDWWERLAKEEAGPVSAKASEYGSNSLEQMGRKMAKLQGREVDKAEALELGCWAYAVGKMERWTDAILRKELCGIDTLVDLGVYTRMVQRIRETGDWPGEVSGFSSYKGIQIHDPDCQGIGKPCCSGTEIALGDYDRKK